MRKFLSLAFRNVFRNRRRTLMTLLMVAGGVSALLLAGGFFASMFYRLREATIQNGLGHLQIYNAVYFMKDEQRVLEYGLEGHAGIAAQARSMAHVRGVAPRIEFTGMVSNGMKSATFLGTAVDAAAERRTGFVPHVALGRGFTEAGDPAVNEALIGAGLARSMSVKPGDGLTLLAITQDGALNGVDVDIVGIVTTGFKEMDDRIVRVSLSAAQRLLQTTRVTKLVVGLDDTDNTEAVYAALRARLDRSRQKVAIKKWVELATYYRQVRLLFSGIFLFVGVIVFFMVVMSSANTLIMAMFERTREIGTMLAMGTPRAWILGLFVAEGVLTGVLGAVAGLLGGTMLGLLLNRMHLYMPAPPGNTDALLIQIRQVPELTVASGILVIVTLALASILPAVRASRLRIVESLAHV
jgi:putative ABC transport system permease protein